MTDIEGSTDARAAHRRATSRRSSRSCGRCCASASPPTAATRSRPAPTSSSPRSRRRVRRRCGHRRCSAGSPTTPGPATPTCACGSGSTAGTRRRRPTNYVGIDVNTTARICSAGHGGQIVVSANTREAVQGVGARRRALRRRSASHHLRGVAEPVALYQVAATGLPTRFPPLRTVGDELRSGDSSAVGRPSGATHQCAAPVARSNTWSWRVSTPSDERLPPVEVDGRSGWPPRSANVAAAPTTTPSVARRDAPGVDRRVHELVGPEPLRRRHAHDEGPPVVEVQRPSAARRARRRARRAGERRAGGPRRRRRAARPATRRGTPRRSPSSTTVASSTFIDGDPMNWATNRSRAIRTARAVCPSCTIRPSRITRDAVAHRHRLDLVVGDADRGHAEPALDPADGGAGLAAQLGVEVRHRLVEQQQPRRPDDRPTERRPLALAAGQLRRTAIEHVGDVQQLGDVAHLRWPSSPRGCGPP